MKGERSLFLVGMMGAGKSTVGPALARRLARPFVDSDVLIEERAGKTIPQIFHDEGEAAFRALEASVIEELGRGDPLVVALGGGALAQPGAAAKWARCATLVYLRASPEKLLQRVGDGSSRPMLRGLDRQERLARLRELAAQREAGYLTARVIVDTDEVTIREVVAEIALRIQGIESERESRGRERS